MDITDIVCYVDNTIGYLVSRYQYWLGSIFQQKLLEKKLCIINPFCSIEQVKNGNGDFSKE